ncbi:hypothetical protein [Antarctobacter jejuensis]|uniref:hypothetical protein n=1 Tax=Antarctobacter jejuensis TaxID=1439938 RepID=UPI003FCF8E3C
MTFQLAACAEMLWRDKFIDWRASRLKEMGFGVGLWNWPDHDLAKLEATGANFTIMNGYLVGRLSDAEGADALLASAREAAQVVKRLGVDNPGRCEPGTGEINYAGVAKALNAMGYSGPIGMEAFAAEDPEAALDSFRTAFTV